MKPVEQPLGSGVPAHRVTSGRKVLGVMLAVVVTMVTVTVLIARFG